MAATIVAGIGILSSATGTLFGIKNANSAASASQQLMEQQNAEQQQLIDQTAAADKKQQDQTQAATQATQANVSSIATKAATGQGRSGTILTSPLAALSGTRGIPAGGAPSTSAGLGSAPTGGKTLIGM